MRTPELEIYQDLRKEWRWRVRHPNGNIVADSAESYKNRLDCVNGYHAAQEAEPAP